MFGISREKKLGMGEFRKLSAKTLGGKLTILYHWPREEGICQGRGGLVWGRPRYKSPLVGRRKGVSLGRVV